MSDTHPLAIAYHAFSLGVEAALLGKRDDAEAFLSLATVGSGLDPRLSTFGGAYLRRVGYIGID